jgi:hypothetical protein
MCVCKWYVLGPHWIPEQLAHPGHCHTPWRALDAQQPDQTACCAWWRWDRGARHSPGRSGGMGRDGKHVQDGALISAGSRQTRDVSASSPRAPSTHCGNCRLHQEAPRRRTVMWPVEAAFEPLQRRSAGFHRPDIVESLKCTAVLMSVFCIY